MGRIQKYASQVQNVLSNVELTAYLKQHREKWCAMLHTCIKLHIVTKCSEYISE